MCCECFADDAVAEAFPVLGDALVYCTGTLVLSQCLNASSKGGFSQISCGLRAKVPVILK